MYEKNVKNKKILFLMISKLGDTELEFVLNVTYKTWPSVEKYYICYNMSYGNIINRLSPIHLFKNLTSDFINYGGYLI